MSIQYQNIQRNVMPPVQVTSPLTGTVFMVIGSGEQRPRTLAFRPGYFDIYDIKGLLISSIPDPQQDAVDVARLAALYDASVRVHYPDEVEMRESAPIMKAADEAASPPVWIHDAVGNVNQRSGLTASWNLCPVASEYNVQLIDGESAEVVSWFTAPQTASSTYNRYHFSESYHLLRRVPHRAMLRVTPMRDGRKIIGSQAYIELSQNQDL